VNVLRNMIRAVRSGGEILDLQVIRPNPRVELGRELICEIDGRPLFEKADAAANAVDAMVRSGRLTEGTIDDHDVRKHYPNGTDLVDDFEDAARCIPEGAIARLHAIMHPLIVRERCRLRRFTVVQTLDKGEFFVERAE
jgi:hypothetical protein